jgi:hypothetical protein
MKPSLTPDQERIVEEGMAYANVFERRWVRRALRLRIASGRLDRQISDGGLKSTVYLYSCRMWWLIPAIYFFVTIWIPRVAVASSGSFHWFSFLVFSVLFIPGIVRWSAAMKARQEFKRVS